MWCFQLPLAVSLCTCQDYFRANHSAHPFLYPLPHPTQRGLLTKNWLWVDWRLLCDTSTRSWTELDLTADLASVSWMWISSTHLHRDPHWYLTASSSQGIYRSWHHNHPRLLCQTVHPWNEEQTTLIHPAHNQMGGGEEASSPLQETRATQSLAGLMVKAWNWEAPQTQCTIATQTFHVLGFFYRCQRPAKCAGHICRAESAGKESNWTGRGEVGRDTFWSIVKNQM